MERNREYRSSSQRPAKRSICSHRAICLSIKSIRPHASSRACPTKARFFPVRMKVTLRNVARSMWEKVVFFSGRGGGKITFYRLYHVRNCLVSFCSCLDCERKRNPAEYARVILIRIAHATHDQSIHGTRRLKNPNLSTRMCDYHR